MEARGGRRHKPPVRPKPFRSAQLARCKAAHEAHWRALPGGRPLIMIDEPRWWVKRRTRRKRRRGSGAEGEGRPPEERLLARVRGQLAVIRREDTLLETYAARVARDAARTGVVTQPSEVGRARQAVRAAKRKIQAALREMEDRVEQQWRAQPDAAAPLFRRSQVRAGRARYSARAARPQSRLWFDPAEVEPDGWCDGRDDPGLVWRGARRNARPAERRSACSWPAQRSWK